MHPEVPVGKSDLTEGEKSGSPSSSSSLSSSEDFFQMDASEHSKSTTDTTGPLKLDEDAHLALEDTEIEISSYPFPKSGEFDQWSPGPTPPLEVSGLIPESSLDGASARQSPPIQVMGRSGDYPDLYRIPSAVFARNKSSTPMEWSVASNESLFSIHMGNNSFSRDHIFLMGMSGELGKSGNLINFPDFPVSLPPDTVVPDTANKSTDLGEHFGVTEAAAETMREVLRTTAEDRCKEKMPPAEGIRLSSSHSHRSDGSEASIISFAFPILTGEGGRRSVSVKVDSEQQSQLQSQPRTPGATQNAARTKWFRCFSCWSENCKLFHIPRNKHST